MEPEASVRLQHYLNMEKRAIVGLEYLVFLNDEQKCPFICLLCNKKGVFQDMMVHHFASVRHKVQVMMKNFPGVVTSLVDKFPERNHFFNTMLNHLCCLVDMKVARAMPYITSSKDYEENCLVINQILLSKTCHRPKLLEELLSTVNLIVPRNSSDTTQQKSLSLAKLNETKPGGLTSVESRTKKRSSCKRSSNDVPSSPSSEVNNSKKSRRSDEFSGVVQAYGRRFSEESERIHEKYSNYLHSPDLFPRYTEEWDKFWWAHYDKCKNREEFHKKDLKPQWRDHLTQLFTILEREEIFEMKRLIRRDMKLPVERREKKKSRLSTKSKTEKPNSLRHKKAKLSDSPIRDRGHLAARQPPISPQTETLHRKPLFDLNDLASGINDFVNVIEVQITESETAETEENVNAIETITNGDLIDLFGNYDQLTSRQQADLVSFMKKVEKVDPSRFKSLMNSTVERCESVGEEKIVFEIPSETEETIAIDDEDDDDYSLDDNGQIMKTAQNNVPIVISSDSETDSEKVT